ncbi:MAG: hypothetical protein OQK04_17995 [Kangiellaceae bacterium]|nr:hypothetical protein [Kangiellaceae bacterium]MCW9000608.1 hypothetical protein [Kangiellaceae bacterium]
MKKLQNKVLGNLQDVIQDEINSATILTEGFWFYFEVDGSTIAANCSAWSGKEYVYIDDELVSETRNLTSRTGEHHFELNNREYKIKFNVVSVLVGELTCEIYQGSNLIAEQDRAFYQKRSSIIRDLGLIVVFGFVIGFSAMYLVKVLG